jgi:hypothetical protein
LMVTLPLERLSTCHSCWADRSAAGRLQGPSRPGASGTRVGWAGDIRLRHRQHHQAPAASERLTDVLGASLPSALRAVPDKERRTISR